MGTAKYILLLVIVISSVSSINFSSIATLLVSVSNRPSHPPRETSASPCHKPAKELRK